MNQISLLTTHDLNDAFAIDQLSHVFPWSKKIFASNQGERYLNFALRVDGELVAFSITQIVMDEATLFNLAVDPSYQRRGLGRQLLHHLIDELKKRDVMTLWLEVRASNSPAIALYEQLYFNEVSVRCNYYPTKDGKENAIMMARSL